LASASRDFPGEEGDQSGQGAPESTVPTRDVRPYDAIARMGVPLNGYRTSRLLRSSGYSSVYEAVREADGSAVVAKVFDLESDDVEPRVEHEFALIEALEIDGVVKALGLQRVGDQLVLLLERVRGVDLAEYSHRRPLELDKFFSIAIQIADVLDRVHARRVIHRDIKPTNILIEPDTGRVYLADFGISVLLESERRHIYDPAVLEGTLPYVSPEQTGRTGRTVDFRSDLYSLGVTFYELLTGRRPFEFAAPLELIHAHLARTPEPPHARRPGLPDGISRLVMKLLEKAPEHRYQTAAGLAADLRKLQQLIGKGKDGRSLVLGRHDFPRTLQLPHQLYGRMQERHDLVDELEQVMRAGTGRVMLLAGPPGIGKSSLLADFEGPVAGFGGYLARGKFDPNREQPYSAFIEAFTGLVEQVLTESEARLRHWRAHLDAALGGVGRVVCELVPNLALVIGEQPPVPELEPHEARNRLHLAIARFLAAFCDEGVPLVLVLDDLHGADRSSLALLRALIEGGRQGALLILGSFQEQEHARGQDSDEPEIAPQDPLRQLIDTLATRHRVRVTRLQPLSEDAVEALISDALARTGPELRSLAQIIGRKTDNNPLFIRQFLTHLAEHGLLQPSEQGWSWDEQAIEAAAVPDDVLTVMTAKLASISVEARELLGRAALIGTRFDLSALEILSERPRAALATLCHELAESGLLGAVGREYSFAHDRLRDAALALLPIEQSRELHRRYGQRLLADMTDDLGERLFEIVDHLDAGLERPVLAAPLDDRLELGRLNLRAGSRAIDTAAYEPALHYLEQGIELLADQRDEAAERGAQAPHYELLVGLHLARAQALALTARHDDAREAFADLLGWRLDQVHFGRVAARWVRLLGLADQNHHAIEFGLEALARCGHRLGREPSAFSAGLSLVRAWLAARGWTSARLRALPDCDDEGVSAAMEIITALKPATYVLDPQLFVRLIALHVQLFLRHGFHPTCPLALAQLAIGVGPGLGRIEDAIGLCERGLELADRVPHSPVRARVESAAYLFVWHLGRPFAEPLARLDDSYGAALEAGDFEYAGYMGALGLSMHLEIGTHLRVIERLSQRLEGDLGRWGSLEMLLVATTVRSICLTLAGPDDELDDDERERLARSLDPEVIEARGGSRVMVYATITNRAMVRLLLGDAVEALSLCLPILDDVEQVMLGSWMVPRTALVVAVAAALTLDDPRCNPVRGSAAMRKALRMLRRWARNSADNYAHYLDLAAGLHAYSRGDADKAMRRIERARLHAQRQGCRWVEGLAGEQLGAIATREGLVAFAAGAYQQAWDTYAAWGATAKLEQLREALPDQFGDLTTTARSDRTRSSGRRRGSTPRGSLRPSEHPEHSGSNFSQLPSSATSAESLDFASVLQSVRVMTEDLRLEEVVGRVLHAAITNAGADRGVLLLDRDGVLGIVAEAEVDGERKTYDEPIRLRDAQELCPTTLVNFVLRTEQALVLDDARADPRFAGDEYVARTGVQSLLGMPIVKGKRRLGALVLENRLSSHCFTPERLEALALITGQAAAALDNARLYNALRRSEARWRSLVDGAPDVIALLNERGEVEFVNRGNLIEPGAEAGGRLLELFLSSNSADEWRDALAAVLRDGARRELEIEIVREQQESLWYTARLAPIDAEGGGARHAVAVATDITQRKRAESEKHSLEAQLRQQQRLESVGTLASGVAHEINNPVQGILNYAELIVDNAHDQNIVREFAAEITTESNRVATIVRNLLAFSRQEREQRMEEADVGELVNATLSLIRAVMRKDHIQLRVAIPKGLPLVRCRIQQIQQIVMNLVTNARDALNERYKGYDERKLIEIRGEVRTVGDRRWVRLIVEDHGAGIPADVLPRIFDPFFTTKGRDQGTGLGLAVSHGIAKEHGGELSVDVSPGQGTRFMLDLPEFRPEFRPEVRPEGRPEVRPEVRPEGRPEVRPEVRPAIEGERAQPTGSNT
jgi:PAS domain S-box-containing protein